MLGVKWKRVCLPLKTNPQKFELVVNLEIAKVLVLEIPESIVPRSDEVICCWREGSSWGERLFLEREGRVVDINALRSRAPFPAPHSQAITPQPRTPHPRWSRRLSLATTSSESLRSCACAPAWVRRAEPASESGCYVTVTGPTDWPPAPGGCLKLPMLPSKIP